MPDAVDRATSPLDGIVAGGGGMGAMMRTVNWDATPIGPVEAWPQSLRTAAGICLASRFPMLIWWGPGLTQIYNDGYVPVLGAKHPAALGQRGDECWAEIWSVVGPMYDTVRATGESTWAEDLLLVMERYGYVEETYFTFSYSAIRDESGGVGGVLVTCVETTERVLSERRLGTLRALAERAGQAQSVEGACAAAAAVLAANPGDVPFALLYLLDDDGERASLAGFAGLEPGTAASPRTVSLSDDGDGGHGWPLARVARTGRGETVEDVRARFGDLPGGPWPHAPRAAVVLPVAGRGEANLAGVLVAGATPARALDEGYRAFFEMAAGHVASAVANARAYEGERRRAEALAEIDRAKTAFFGNVSHEFRTPLTLMLGPVADLLDGEGGALAPAQREALDVVHRNGLRLQRLVNTLLDFSRIEAGRVRASFVPTDLAALTADLASAFRSAVERAGLTLAVRAAPLPGPVHVDRDMWEKIVLNLLSNAFKHTFEGAIELDLRASDGAAELTVRDTGVGIAPEELPRLFERFHRVAGARARTQEGSGIGLALVQELVRLHGGDIRAESRPGRGSAFTVRIPLGAAHLPPAQVAEENAPPVAGVHADAFVEEALRWLPDAFDAGAIPAEAPAPRPYPRSAAGASPARVLVADDNADMRRYLARLLGRHWEVETAPDGAAALATALARPPDLVLADVMMPGLDGFGLLRALREDARTAPVPVVLLSARAGEEARVEGLDAGADDYVVKPFGARELVARVGASLELARVRRQAEAVQRRLLRELEVERARLETIIEQAPAAIAVVRGPEHVFERANPRYYQVIGRRDVIGRRVRDVFHEVRDPAFFALLDQVYRTGEPYVGNEVPFHFERTPGGPLEEVYVNFVYQPLRDAAGEVTGIFAHGVDVTDLVRARKGAEAASQAKSDFMATISHELRTPLNAILGYTDLLSMGIPEAIGDRAREQVGRVGSSARHLQQLIDELLTFTRIQAGREEVEPARVELAGVVDEVRAVIEPLAAQKSLRFVVDTGGAPESVETDPRKLRQILLNLLGNAVKFTHEGEVRLSVSPDGDGLAFAVRDTGIGISPEHVEQLFEPFWQADQSRTRAWGGTGLGLAISRRLAGLLGGEVTVESEPGRGSTFTLRLPLAPPPAASRAE